MSGTGPPRTDPGRVVIVGASLAGLNAAEELRRSGWAGHLTIVGDEPHQPYDRPPLSKTVAAGRMEPGRTALPHTVDLDAEWRLGVAATALDRDARTVALADGGTVPYDRLLVATGTRLRPWPDAEEARLDGVLGVYSHEDSVELRRRLDAGPRRVVVLGASFVGSELASICRERDIPVTLLDRSGFPMDGALGQTVGAAIGELQRAYGVDLRPRTTVEALESDGGRVTAARLTDGDTVEADLVVAGIGTLRNTEWLDGSGLRVARVGVLCDGHLRATTDDGEVDEAVFAAGDVAACPIPRLRGVVVGTQHWSSAVDGGRHAARSMLGLGPGGGPPQVFDELPRFWSNQFGLNIKCVGVPGYADTVQITQGALEGLRVVITYGHEGLVCGIVAVNAARELEGYVPMMVGEFPLPFTAPDWRDGVPPRPVPARIPKRTDRSHDAPSEVFDPTADEVLTELGHHPDTITVPDTLPGLRGDTETRTSP